MAANKYSVEGQQQMKEAEKHLKTGLLKWSQDYDLAAMSYTQAATSFKNAKEPAKSMDCFIKSGDCHLKNKVIFQAAKSFEQGAFAAREIGDFKKVAELINRAYLLYIENGTSDTAGNLLDRGGKMLEEQLPEQAVAMYKKAADLSQIQDKASSASEMFDRAARLLVKMEKYDEAAKVLQELVQHELMSPSPAARRFVLLLVLVHLKRDDFVAAKKIYEEGSVLPDFNGSGELGLARTLLDAYDNYDRETFKSAASGPFIRQLDPAYARLARSLDVPEGEDLPSIAPKAQPLPVKVAPVVITPEATPSSKPEYEEEEKSKESPVSLLPVSVDIEEASPPQFVSQQELARSAVPAVVDDEDDLT